MLRLVIALGLLLAASQAPGKALTAEIDQQRTLVDGPRVGIISGDVSGTCVRIAAELPAATVGALATAPSARVAASALLRSTTAADLAATAAWPPLAATPAVADSQPIPAALPPSGALPAPHVERSGLSAAASAAAALAAVIDDAEIEGDRGFDLLLAADPKVSPIRGPR